MFVWKDEKFSVGDKLLDSQHRQILEIMNRLIEFAHGKQCDELVVQELMVEMNEYALAHFKEEETRLALLAPGLLQQQIDSHRSYLERVNALVMGQSSAQQKYSEALDFLLEWWERHILEEDMQYKEYL